MNPYRSYMQKAAMGELRRAFLSGSELAPHQVRKLERLAERAGRWSLRKHLGDAPTEPSVLAHYRPEDNMLEMHVHHWEPGQSGQAEQHRESLLRYPSLAKLLPGFRGRGKWHVTNDQAMGEVEGVTDEQFIQDDWQRKGIGRHTGAAMDRMMTGFGANHLETLAVNPTHVTPYRQQQGYKVMQRHMDTDGNEYHLLYKQAPDSAAVARDKHLADKQRLKSLIEAF